MQVLPPVFLACAVAVAAAAASSTATAGPHAAAEAGLSKFFERLCQDGSFVGDVEAMSGVVEEVFAPGATVVLTGTTAAPMVLDDYPAAIKQGLYLPFAGMRICLPHVGPFLPALKGTPLSKETSVGGFAQQQTFVGITSSCGVTVPRIVFGEYDAQGRITMLTDALGADALPTLTNLMQGKCDTLPTSHPVAEAERALMEQRLQAYMVDMAQRSEAVYDGTYSTPEVAAKQRVPFDVVPGLQGTQRARDVFRVDSDSIIAVQDGSMLFPSGPCAGRVLNYSFITRREFNGKGQMKAIYYYIPADGLADYSACLAPKDKQQQPNIKQEL